MELYKYGTLNHKLDHSNSLDIKELLMMYCLMLILRKLYHVEMIGKLKSGKIQCNLLFLYIYSNGKNITVKAHSGPVLKISLSQQ